jgi:hypothetical protein
VKAEIVFEENPGTAQAILDSLPLESKISRWGEEVYFQIPVNFTEENSRKEVEIGDLGYWPQGKCFCIFFGKTPISPGEKPVAASPVNVFGRVLDDPTIFKETRNGEEIRIEKS